MHPPPAWYASGLRWLASGLVALAEFLEGARPSPWPLEPTPAPASADELLCEARLRASRGV
jgi:hypothetical protein